MKEAEEIMILGRIYEAVLEKERNEDYVVDLEQLRRYEEALDFFCDVAKKCGGEVETSELIPKERHGGITATFTVFDVYGDDLKRFCEIMKYTSAFGIDATLDGVCISMTIPNLFFRKNERVK